MAFWKGSTKAAACWARRSGNNRLSSESGRKSPENKFVHAVLMFNDVSYLKYDPTTTLLMVSQGLRSEMATPGSSYFLKVDSLLSVAGERSITSAWFKRRLANRAEKNRSWLLYSSLKSTAYFF